jgi:hypothetical protein
MKPKGVLSSPLRDIAHLRSNVSLSTYRVPPIIAYLPHMISGAETRELQKVAVAKKKCIQVRPLWMHISSWQRPRRKLSHVRIVSMIFKRNWYVI